VKNILTCVILVASSLSADAGVSIATWKGNALAAYTLTHDDSYRPDQEIMGNALTERGLVGTFFVNPGKCWDTAEYGWTRPPKEVFTEFAAQGHELGSHTMWHQSVMYDQGLSYAFANEQELRDDCIQTKAILDELNQKSTQSIGYPWGGVSAASQAVVADYFLTGRVSGWGQTNDVSPDNMYTIKTYTCGASSPVPINFGDYDVCTATFSQYVDKTLASGGWGIEQYHDLNTTYKLNPEAYFEHLDVLQNKQATNELWIATEGDVSRYVYSRSAATVENIQSDAEVLKFRVDDFLDDSLFDVPLTIMVEVPQAWTTAEQFLVSKNNETRSAKKVVEDNTVYAVFDSLANAGLITLYPNFVAVGLSGDLNGDGSVSSRDLDLVRANWTVVLPAKLSTGDANGDGYVGSADLDLVRSNWGARSVMSVPEPAAVILLLGGILAAWHMRRR